MHPYVHCSIIYKWSDMETIYLSINNEWIMRKWCLYKIEYDSTVKKNEILTSATIWMGLENTALYEIHQRKANTI